MKKYLKHFSFLLVLFVIVLVVFIGVVSTHKPTEEKVYVRSNTSCKTSERVFDYADVLTDQEEADLRQLIAEKEKEIGCDIVLVTMTNFDVNSDYAMMNYADDFYDNYMFGFDEPWGDGALYLDNFMGVGNSLSWFSTSGRVQSTYSDSRIRDLVDTICEDVNDNPYGAYRRYVNSLAKTMNNAGRIGVDIPTSTIWIAAFVITLIYILVCINHNVGKRTTDANTYVKEGHANFIDHRDVFISKHTTRVKISSSSGGGGGHISSGGHSHGGGGGRH